MNLNERLASNEKSGRLAAHPVDLAEIKQHVMKAGNFLKDAQNSTNSLETRFTIANGAGHQLLTAALKMKGYRTTNEKGHRMILYDLVDALVPGAAGAQESLSRAHNARNKADYDGDDFDVTEGLVEDVVEGVKNVKEEVDLMLKQLAKSAPPATSSLSQPPANPPAPPSAGDKSSTPSKPPNKPPQNRGR